MAKKMLIDATHAEETRVVVVDGNKVEEFDFESENKRQLAGNIYLAKVTRVEPSLQAAFVDYGGNRHGFLAFSEIHPDYYQIPVADREALMEEERAYAEALRARDDEEDKKPARSRSRSRTKAEKVKSGDAVETKEVEPQISGMETIDLTEDADTDAETSTEVTEGSSPMERVSETPVEEPQGVAAESTLDAADAEVEAADAQAVETPAEADAAVVETAPEGAQAAVETAFEGDIQEPADEDDQDDDQPVQKRSDATSKDSSIESVADDDDSEDIRPARKPRPRRYKIQEVIKVRQVLLVQVVKEERGNKGAALTTYLSLAGRYCVLMPNTARGGGISRKITNVTDRKKLKDIAAEIDVPSGAGLIIRTAGAKRTKSEIKRDYEYLQRMWEQIRELTLKSIAPAKIYEEGDLIKRSIRDLYNRDIDEVLVEGEAGYRIAKDFMKMIMPSHAKNVQKYEDPMPLFARFQVESYLAGMFNPTVQLRSGGYIVIGVTEALVAIDVNSGRATKEGSIEETALKTNLEAAEEVARQLRLRDLAGLIVIDFIDMDERKNNAAVEKRMKDKLKTDRARIQVGRISGFGLMEMSRQRLRPGMIEATTQPCPACHGTGLIRSDDNMALSILRQIEEEGVRRRSREVLVRCPVNIANFLMNQKREHIAQIEGRYGLSVRIEGDPHLVSPDFALEKFKTATRTVPVVTAPVVSVDTSLMEQIDAAENEKAAAEPEVGAEAEAPAVETLGEDETKPKRKRRRRRRRSKSGSGSDTATDATDGSETTEAASDDASTAPGDTSDDAKVENDDAPVTEASAENVKTEVAPVKPKRTRKPRISKAKKAEMDAAAAAEAAASGAETVEAVAPDAGADEPEAKPKSTRTRRKPTKSRAKVAKDEEQPESVEGSATAAPEEATPVAVAEDPVVDAASDTAIEPNKSEPVEPETEGAAPEQETAQDTGLVQDTAQPVVVNGADAQADDPVEVAESQPTADPQDPVVEVETAGGSDTVDEAQAETPVTVEHPVIETEIVVAETPVEPQPEPQTAAEPDPEPAPAAAPEAEVPSRPKRRGWWSLGS
ncbi:Rne/Rng family ribonuclease [Rhodobacteraceae bacterium M382]|nr:Rne/Rng family ribonuclease [Rhodobacteraceae bacterium M382]